MSKFIKVRFHDYPCFNGIFVSCGGKRKSCHLEFGFVSRRFFGSLKVHCGTHCHWWPFQDPFMFGTSHNILLHEDNFKEDEFSPRYGRTAAGTDERFSAWPENLSKAYWLLSENKFHPIIVKEGCMWLELRARLEDTQRHVINRDNDPLHPIKC